MTTGTNSSAPANLTCLSDQSYTVQTGDTCQSIALAHSVSQGTLRLLNSLYPDCSNMVNGQVLCPQNMSNLRLADERYLCLYRQHQRDQPLRSDRMSSCRHHYSNADLTNAPICVFPAYGVYTPTTIAGLAPTPTAAYANNTMTPPGATAPGTTLECGLWYKAQSGDTCSVISIAHNILVDLFELINPSIDSGCDNITPGLYYCVQPVMGWNTTASNITTATIASPPAPTPHGTIGVCYEWYVPQANDTCSIIEASFGITFAQFVQWNPDIDSYCYNLMTGVAYCVSGATIESAPAPTPTGTTSQCYEWYVPQANDTCSTIEASFKITFAQFAEWNPNIDSDCYNLMTGVAYCVSGARTTTIENAPAPTPTGTTSQCYEWYVPKAGDTCSTIEASFEITFAQFVQWNPNIDSDCYNLMTGVAYCVSGAMTTSTTASTTSSTSTTSSVIATPTPYQANMTTSCTAFYQAVSGNTCSGIATTYNITLTEFYDWNPAVGTDCTSLWVNEWYCVAGPVS